MFTAADHQANHVPKTRMFKKKRNKENDQPKDYELGTVIYECHRD